MGVFKGIAKILGAAAGLGLAAAAIKKISDDTEDSKQYVTAPASNSSNQAPKLDNNVSSGDVVINDLLDADIDVDYEDDDIISNYQLGFDECLISRKEFVKIYGMLKCSANVVSLTTRNLVVEYTTGRWRKKSHIEVFPLNKIKQYKNAPQVKLGKYRDAPVLVIYFENAQMYLNFCAIKGIKKQRQCIKEWVSQISDVYSTIQAVKSAKTVVEKVSNTVICKNCGKELSSNLNFCTECGTALKNNDDSCHKENLSLEKQMELLQMLKDLLEAGVLSQEEFEKKKKEIL